MKTDGESEPHAEEARFFVESKLLQRDVAVILESVNNNNFVGTIVHPFGNIAEHLLRYGFAKCVDWSLAVMSAGEHYTIYTKPAYRSDTSRLFICCVVSS